MEATLLQRNASTGMLVPNTSLMSTASLTATAMTFPHHLSPPHEGGTNKEQPPAAAHHHQALTPERTARMEAGQCPSCGQQLYKPKKNLFSTAFGKMARRNSTGGSHQKQHQSNLYTRHQQPLTIPGLVERGQCLKCCLKVETSSDEEDDESSTFVATMHPDVTTTIDEEDPPVITTAVQPVTTTNAVYTGPLNDYGERQGEGCMQWANGDVYTGEFFNGRRHGHGTLVFADSSDYVGEWQCNLMHGSGTRRYVNGDIYIGEYVDGKRSGSGRFYFCNGDLFVGAWEEDFMHGFGRYYYSDGQRFEGHFCRGQRHGKGKVQKVSGALDIYLYQQNEKVGDGVRWSPERTKAWKLSNGILGRKKKTRITTAEAVSIVYDIEQQAHGLLEEQSAAANALT